MKKIASIIGMAGITLTMTATAATPVRIPQSEDAPKYKSAKAHAPEEEEETWKTIGNGEYRDNIVHSWFTIPGYPQMDVEVQESEQTPGRYRIVKPYHNYPMDLGAGAPEGEAFMIVDASDPMHCYIEPCLTRLLIGLDPNKNVMQMAVWSIADDYYNNIYGNWNQADIEGVCGRLENGSVTFPAGAILTTTMYADKEPNWDMLWIPSNPNGMWRLRLPGAPKLDLNIDFTGLIENDLTYDVRMEESVEYVKVAFFKGEYNNDMTKSIIDGTVDTEELDTDGQVCYPYTEDGIYTFIAVPYYEGEPLAPYYITKEMSFNEAEWRKCGKVHYTEAILSSNEMTVAGQLNIDPDDYDVELEENVANPGLFRLVDPYGPPYVYASSGYDDSHKYYMEIDATDVNSVFIKRMEPIGLSFAWGRNGIESRAYRKMTEGMTKEEVKMWEITNNTPLFGTHADNKITFPKDAIYWIVTDQLTTPTYWANANGKFCIEFKEGQVIGGTNGVEGITNDSETASEWYNLQGVRLNKRPAEKGIYIERRGNVSTKVMVK